MRKKAIIAGLFFLLFILPLSTQDRYSSISFRLLPGVDVPLGTSSQYFKIGGSGTLSAAYKPPISLPLYVSTEFGYNLMPFNLVEARILNLLSIGGGLGLDLRFLGRLAANLYVRGGYYYGFTKDYAGNAVAGGNPYLWAGGELSFYVTPSLSVGVGSAYKNYFGQPQSLLNSVGVYLGTAYRFPISGQLDLAPPATRPGLLKLAEIRTEGIFPVFYQFYDNHPIGRAVLLNQEKGPVKDIKVSVFIKRYMDSPKVYEVPGELKRGEKREIDLLALFTEKVLEITEGTKVAAEITLEYSYQGQSRKSEHIETVKLENRNASIWDDDRRAAAFVTAKDPAVLKFAKNIAALVRDSGSEAIDGNLRMAMALHQALSLYGVRYVVDPKTPYIELVKNKQAVDFLQFPRQTLEYKAGDCDDLSILYAAMLEAVSVDTAFITAPDHIYIAVALDVDPSVASKTFSRMEELIIRENRVWLPLEVTEVKNSFLRAWEVGAKEWREFAPKGEAGFYPMQEAWSVFEPVGLPGQADIGLPETGAIAQSYRGEIVRLVEREIGDKAKDLKARIARSGDNPRLINQLGVLYARYGLNDQAAEQFSSILRKMEYTPALLNIGNIFYLKKDLAKALEYYDRAYQQEPENSTVLLSLVQINRELEKYDQVKESYARLQRLAPELAERYSYLGQAGETTARAGEAGKGGVLIWEE